MPIVRKKHFFMSRNSSIQTVTLRVHPAVARHLENNFPKSGHAFDLRNHYLYTFLSACLQRTNIKVPSHGSRNRHLMREVSLVVTGWDYAHYGGEIPEKFQLAFSQLVYRKLLHEACYAVMVAHLVGGIPRDTAIKEFLFGNLYEEDELAYPALRKHYQRHWIEQERKFASDFEAITATSRRPHDSGTNKIVRDVPILT